MCSGNKSGCLQGNVSKSQYREFNSLKRETWEDTSSDFHVFKKVDLDLRLFCLFVGLLNSHTLPVNTGIQNELLLKMADHGRCKQ